MLDSSRQTAPGPVDSLVLALAACSSIDVVEILTKRRTPPRSLRVAVDFTRVDGMPPPRPRFRR
jgi:putative redox protein